MVLKKLHIVALDVCALAFVYSTDKTNIHLVHLGAWMPIFVLLKKNLNFDFLISAVGLFFDTCYASMHLNGLNGANLNTFWLGYFRNHAIKKHENGLGFNSLTFCLALSFFTLSLDNVTARCRVFMLCVCVYIYIYIYKYFKIVGISLCGVDNIVGKGKKYL